MAAPGENLRINPDRLWDSLMEMAKIGPGVAGGNNRQTLTDEDGEGRHLFKKWCDAAGLVTGVASARILPRAMEPLIGPGYRPADRDELGLWQQLERVEEETGRRSLASRGRRVFVEGSRTRDWVGFQAFSSQAARALIDQSGGV